MLGSNNLDLPIMLVEHPDDHPDFCPHCGNRALPIHLTSYSIGKSPETSIVYSLYYCTACFNCFLSRIDEENIDHGSRKTITTYPYPQFITEFPDSIKKLSPNFVKIYNQAEAAEHANLDEICGPGYRKSLEFLIKDFAIRRSPDSKDKILKTPLAKCIENYMPNFQIKNLAKASTWLGNDEVHYERKHIDYDLKQLKSFISATAAYINYDLVAEAAEDLLSARSLE